MAPPLAPSFFGTQRKFRKHLCRHTCLEIRAPGHPFHSSLQSGYYQPVKASAAISNAMDVGDLSNFVRIMQIFGQSFPLASGLLSSYSISDAETMETISRIYGEHHYLLDRHGAVGYISME